MIDEQSAVIKNDFASMCDKNYLTDECRNHLESGIAEIELVLEQYVRPVLKRLSLAFGGPETHEQKNRSPKARGKEQPTLWASHLLRQNFLHLGADWKS